MLSLEFTYYYYNTKKEAHCTSLSELLFLRLLISIKKMLIGGKLLLICIWKRNCYNIVKQRCSLCEDAWEGILEYLNHTYGGGKK